MPVDLFENRQPVDLFASQREPVDLFEASKKEGLLDKVKGVGEAALVAGLGAVTWIPEGVANIADMGAATLAGQEPTFEMGKNVKNALNYQPKTETGKKLAGYIAAPFEAISEKSKQAADYVYDKTGNEYLATAVRTAGESIPFVVPAGVVKGVKSIKGGLKTLDNMKGVIEPVKEIPTKADLPSVETVTKPSPKAVSATIEKPQTPKPPVVESVKPDLQAMEGDMKPHRTAQRIEAEGISQELLKKEGLGEDIAKYKEEKGMMDAQARLGVEIMDKDWDSAVKMALQEMPSPEGVRPGTMVTAVAKRALEKGDFDTIYKLGTSDKSFTLAQEVAKDLKSFDQGLSDNPVTAIRSIINARREELARTGEKVEIAKQNAEIERLKGELDTANKSLESYVAKLTSEKAAKSSRVPKKYGESNKLVTRDEYLKVKDELRQQFASQLNAGLDPTIAVKLAKVGAYHLEAGARHFKVWSDRVVADVGAWAQPHLEEIWRQSHESIGKTVKTSDESNLKRYKTRLINETEKLKNKLLDLEPSERNKVKLDAEGIKLKGERDIVKKAYDTAVRKTGTVSREEAATLFDLAKKASALKGDGKFTSDKARLEYGRAQVEFNNFVEKLKTGDTSLATLAKNRVAEFKQTAKENPARAIKDLGIDALGELSDSTIAVVASLDDSFIGRQGLQTLINHPTVWYKAAGRSFTDIYRSLRSKYGNEKAKDILHADLVSRENYLNGYYQKAGILAKFEEQYPTSHPARIPYIGRAFKASEVAFTNTALRMRIGTFDLLLDMAKKSGTEINEKLIKDIGSLTNAATARSHVGSSKLVKNILWAPRMMMANINVLTAHGLGAGLETGFARKQAAYNLMKVVGSTAALAAVLNAIKPGSVETNPISSDFMKYRDGDTHIDFTAGKGQYVTLAARWLTGQSKNAQTKIIKDLSKAGFGEDTYFDVGMDFLINKTTPLVRQGVYVAKGRNFEGDKPTISSAMKDLFVPIPVSNFLDNYTGDYKDTSAIALFGNLADVFGLNANTYIQKEQWNNRKSKALEEKKAQIGEDNFNQANVMYNKEVNKQIHELVKMPEYMALSDEDKKKEVTKLKKQIKRNILGE